ncbi:lysophospholipid acyltransferase family protein [Streptomyces exfoliatus]|uniref:lysophospholipid acyltransferase family protein n=1 Tax=Streptomyces exfoliatus TaxID=1905 RepID=UPI0005642A63|nr:lysophospholipid acyltransferase family protein [Streptomyces exfoliatus]
MNGTTAPSPWLPTAPCTPGRCAAHPESAHPESAHPESDGAPGQAGVVRALVRLTAGLGTVLLGLLVAPATGLLPTAVRLALVRHWTRAAVRAFGVRARYEGVPADGPLLVVANHVSWLDIPLIAAVLPGRMVAKSEVRRWPVLGTLAALGGTLFIARDGLRSLPGTVREMSGVLAGGGRVIVFPEGSTWCGREGGRFRPAAFQAALDAGRAVQPVRIDYGPTDAAAYVGADPLGSSLWRVVPPRRLTAVVRVPEPLTGLRHQDRRTLAAAAQRAVEQSGADRRAVEHSAGDRRAVRQPAVDRSGADRRVVAQRAVASDSANLPSLSVHQRSSSSPASARSARTPA